MRSTVCFYPDPGLPGLCLHSNRRATYHKVPLGHQPSSSPFACFSSALGAGTGGALPAGAPRPRLGGAERTDPAGVSGWVSLSPGSPGVSRGGDASVCKEKAPAVRRGSGAFVPAAAGDSCPRCCFKPRWSGSNSRAARGLRSTRVGGGFNRGW